MMRTLTLLSLGLSLATMPAFAHAFLDEASPRVGSTVSTAPRDIRITYTEGVEPVFSHIALLAADGAPVALGTVTLDPANRKQLIAPLAAPLPPGHYEVRWDVVSVDTHRTEGHFGFDYQP